MLYVRGRKRRFALGSLGALMILFLLVGYGLAAGEGAHDDGRLKDLLYRFINFALLVIILFVVVRKTSLKDFFASRRKEIGQKLEDLSRQKEESEGRYRELEKKLKEFEDKKLEIMEQFKTEGIAEKEKIIAEAKERAEQIVTQADTIIEREIQAARDKLRQEVVDMAAQKAQDIIAKEIQDSDQDHLVNEFIERVEKLH
jgi:F-type H+-transporting ATPase subunit b